MFPRHSSGEKSFDSPRFSYPAVQSHGHSQEEKPWDAARFSYPAIPNQVPDIPKPMDLTPV